MRLKLFRSRTNVTLNKRRLTRKLLWHQFTHQLQPRFDAGDVEEMRARKFLRFFIQLEHFHTNGAIFAAFCTNSK